MKVLFIPFYSKNPYQGNLADALRTKGVEIKTIPYVAGLLFPILREVITNWKPDIIHLHWTDKLLLAKNKPLSILKSLRLTFEICLLKLIGVKLIWTVHNLFNHENRNSILEKCFHRFFCIWLYDKIIVMSTWGIEAMVEAYQLPERIKNKIKVIPHGHYIDNYRNSISKLQARKKLGISNRSIVFLFFGMIRPYKGIQDLINEFIKVTDPRVFLLIAGEPSTKLLKNKLEKYSREYKQIKTYLNFIPDHELQIYMNAADTVVLPFSDILNSGSVILAMSFRKALICPNMGSIPELTDENGSFLYNPNNNTGLLNALKHALNATKPQLDSMGDYNYQKIFSYKWKDIAQATKSNYTKIISNKNL